MSQNPGDDDLGLAQLVRLSRLSGDPASPKIQPDTVVTLQIRVTRPVGPALPSTRLPQFDVAARNGVRYHGAHQQRRPTVRLATMAFGLVSMLIVAGVAGIGAYRHVTASSHHLAVDQAVVVPRPVHHAVLLSTTSSAITYRVPAATFTIAVVVDHPCWIVVKSPPDAVTSLLARTILPTSSPVIVPLHGAASVTFAARVISLTVRAGAVVLSVINDPVLGPAYTFVPSTP